MNRWKTGFARSLLAVALGVVTLSGLVGSARADTPFAQTGQSIWGPFETYWKAHGGLSQFGMPRTSVFPAQGGYDAQWFERAQFTYNPSNPDPYKVQLQLLGNILTQSRRSEQPFLPKPASATMGSEYFSATQHNLGGKFLAYWRSHGGLPIYGYPISEQFTEKSRSDGKEYLVQYFERNRFEYHPELAGSEYEVQLGLLGSELLDAQGGPQAFSNLGSPHAYPLSSVGGPVPVGTVVVVGTPEPGGGPRPVPPAPALSPAAGRVLFQDDFSSGDLSAWQQLTFLAPPDTKPAEWRAANGRLEQSSMASAEGTQDEGLIVTRQNDLTNFRLDAYAYATSGEPYGIVFRHSDSGFYVIKVFGAVGSGGAGDKLALYKAAGGRLTEISTSTGFGGYTPATWQLITLTAVGGSVSVRIDGKAVLAASDTAFSSGAIGFYAYADGTARFDNLRVQAATAP